MQSEVIALVTDPHDPDLNLRLAKRDGPIADERVRADLLTRWAIIRGFGVRELRRVIRSGANLRTRHYLAVMTALSDARLPFARNLFLYERRISELPPSTTDGRRAALRHLLSTAEFAGPGGAILVAAMPKSASTYLCSVLSRLIGRPMSVPHSRNDPLGVAFDQLDFVRAYASGGVMHSHLDASTRTLAMVRLFDIRPVVLTRNIFDALASYLDHQNGRTYAGSTLDEVSDDDRRRIGILRMSRHYVDMLASWSTVPEDVDVLWVDYAEVVGDPVAVVERVLEHVGMSAVPGAVEAAVAALDPTGRAPASRQDLRFNRGVAGRGAMFTDEERSWVRALYAEYPHVDFSRIDPDFAA